MNITNVSFDGRTTHVTVEAAEDSMMAGFVGYGQARCRRQDHFEESIGLSIATARATADMAARYEAATTAKVVTQIEYLAEPIDVVVVAPNGARAEKRVPRFTADAMSEIFGALGARVEHVEER